MLLFRFLMPGIRRSLLATLCLTAAILPVAGALPTPAAAAAPPAPSGPERCADLPISSALVTATSCWVTGPTSLVVAGTDGRNPADGVVYVITGQSRLRTSLPGGGRLTIATVANGQACVVDASGRKTGIETSSGTASSGCSSGTVGGPQSRVKAATAPAAGAAATPTPPPATTSYYVYGAYLASCGSGATSGCPLYQDGAGIYSSSTTPSGLLVLDFGAPCYDPHTLTYGTQLFNTFVCTPMDQLVVLARAWIRGYESTNATRTTPTILGLGTSNSDTGADPPGYVLSPGQMYSHGYSWFTSVVRPVGAGLSGPAPITVWAASDIEQATPPPTGDWYDPATSRPWLDAYQAAAGAAAGPKCAATTPYQMLDYGDAVPGAGGWGYNDIYYVAWGAPLACALPEVYYQSMADHWAQVNSWANSQHLSAITFTGVMSEDGGGNPASFSAAQSWNALYNSTGQQALYLTIIGNVATPATPFNAPTGVTAVPGAASATVSWTQPTLDGGHHLTSYTITPYVGSTAQPATVISGSPPPVTAVVPGLLNGTAYRFTVTANSSAGSSAESSQSNLVTPSDAFPYTAVSRQQYQLTGNDGATWQDLDPAALTLSITPSASSTAILRGNADLWTATTGLNQDLGIEVNGTMIAWKESGGYGGTFSPNAAFVESTVAMSSGTTYAVKLKWKTNKPEGGGAIYAGAGSGPYSPTRLTVQLLPTANTPSVSSARQVGYPGGSGWSAIDTTNLAIANYVAPVTGTAVIAGNADLWTARAGYNQDLGIFVDNNLVGWKESGGFAGTYSPNAAFVLGTVPMSAGTSHTIVLAFKANKSAPSGTVYVGAGPGPYSPTTLTLQLIPSGQVVDTVSNAQYSLASSDGSSWSTIDTTNLSIPVNRSQNCLVTLDGNADLWTSIAGINQDLGIEVTPSDAVAYPAFVIGWKESGGFAGTFSPNAAAVETVFAMPAGTSYTASLVWKTNTSSSAAAHAGAGQAPTYSPTRLLAVLTCQ